VIGIGNLPGRVAAHASLMYSNNLGNLVEHFWDTGTNVLKLDTKDEIMDGCLVVHEGVIRNENLRALVERREKKG
jgi:NAD(P) transhydrogenase subunit alpha